MLQKSTIMKPLREMNLWFGSTLQSTMQRLNQTIVGYMFAWVPMQESDSS